MTLRLNGSTSGYVEIDAPATAGSNTLVLPTGNGTSGQVLSTNGSGALSWTSDVMLSAGSASAPSLYFSGDTNTGMWSPAADTLAWSTGGSERMRIDNAGNLLFNATSTLDVSMFSANIKVAANFATLKAPDTNSYMAWQFQNSSGTRVGYIQFSTTSATYSTSSDYRLKENIIPLTSAVDRLNQLQVHRFNFIADPGKTVDGFIAHEAQAVVPECVTGTKDEVDADGNPVYQGIDQSKLVPLLTAALQEALAKIETLESRLTALEAQP